MSVPSLALNWVICFSLVAVCCKAQSPFGFVEVAPSAHANALGGNLISYSKHEGYSFIQNPALLDSATKGQLSVTYSPYFSGHYNAVSYVLPGKRDYTVGLFAQSLNFGRFTETDDIGNVTGYFGVGNYQVGAGVSKKIDRISFGVNARLVNSIFASYWATALAFDWGGTFALPEKGIDLSLVARNVGISLSRSPFTENQLPFNLLLGMSIKPRFMPARIHLVMDHLSEWSAEDVIRRAPLSVPEQILKHFSAGADIFIGDSVYFTVSNNFGRPRGENHHILSGYGLGLNLEIRKATLSVSHSANPSLKNQTVFSLSYQF